MIDFRYHLVSIASVFLALAVGIVLGAGPLKGTISDTLTSEVTKLREDANTLRGEVNAAEAGVQTRDELITNLRPLTLAEVLDGEQVAVVTLPGTPEATVETVQGLLVQAGALTGPAVQVQGTWVSPEPPDATDRSETAAELRALLTGQLPVGISPERVLALSLSSALTSGAPETGAQDLGDGADEGTDPVTDSVEPTVEQTVDPGDDTQPTGAEPTSGGGDGQPGADGDLQVPPGGTSPSFLATRVLQILTESGLVTMSDGTPPAASAVVVLAPDSQDVDAERMTGWVDLVGALSDGRTLVLAGAVPDDATLETNVVLAVRDSGDLSRRLTTVDNLESPIGQTALPLAIAGQLAGTSGHYGVLDTASTLFPPVPVAAP